MDSVLNGFPKDSRMICASLTAQSVEQMLNDMNQAKFEGADVVEIRLNSIPNLQPFRDIKLLLEHKPLPVVVVFGPTWEGDEEDNLEVLLLAKDLGADYIELDLKVASALINGNKLTQLTGTKIIVSCADSTEDFSRLITEIQSPQVDIIKLVSNETNITELLDVFDLLSHSKVPITAYCTGERGLIGQLLAFKFGGIFTYGTIEGNAIPGLPSIDSLTRTYGVKNIDMYTEVFGLVSKPVSHSKGPLLHNPTFRHVDYNGLYVPMLVDDLKEFFSVFPSPDFAGFSVGIPYKEAVIDFCDEVHPLAQSIGAVNTIVRRHNDGKLIGYNTDCEAAITAIEDALKGCAEPEAPFPSPLTGKQFVLVGAGGAGRALAVGAKSRGARVVVFDIDHDRAKSLAVAVSGKVLPFEDLLTFRPEKGAILANATPLGMHPNTDRIPVPKETLRDYKLVFDTVYTPRKTRLLKDAEAAGAIVVSGVEMFLRQAAAQFSLFTRQKGFELISQ